VASGPSERARLLGLARDYVLEHGVVDLSLSELARGIGSNNRMLLYHFTSLDQILGAAIDEILDRSLFVAKLTELMLAEKSSEARIAAAWTINQLLSSGPPAMARTWPLRSAIPRNGESLFTMIAPTALE